MKDSKVSAVIVGADRVAANGDPANKIGTYSLALCAMHDNIPFYVPAPLTSIDSSLSSGKEIIIEERSPKELLNSRGRASCCIWNFSMESSFRCYFCKSLISGIITEKGVITKTGTDGFEIKDFIKRTVGQCIA